MSEVPRIVVAALVLAAILHLATDTFMAKPTDRAAVLPPPLDARLIRLAGLGEAAAAARGAMLYLQSIDLSGGLENPYQGFDYERLVGWLGNILAADPRSGYPLFTAARIYAEVPDPQKMRRMLEFIYEEFGDDPNARWPWLAHAALLAKHRLNDLPLARRYAAAIQQRTTGPGIPLWARQMEVFILEDMDELEAARIMLGGLIESGKVRDPDELRFLKGRLDELESKLRKSFTGRPRSSTP